jgi:hypothetical protein
VLVVGVENDVAARDDVVGGESQRDSSGSGIAAERGDDQVRVCLDDVTHEIVDCVEVAPRLCGRILRSLDQVEVDPV